MGQAASADRLSFFFRRLITCAAGTRKPSVGLLTAAKEIRVSAHGDGLIILHIPSGKMFSCNSTGCRIWNGVINGSSADDVSGEISRDFGLDPDVAREHTNAFVAKLEREGLLIRA